MKNKNPSGKKVLSSCCHEPIKVISGDEGTSFYACAGCGECVNPDGTNPSKPIYHSNSEKRRIEIQSMPQSISVRVPERPVESRDEKKYTECFLPLYLYENLSGSVICQSVIPNLAKIDGTFSK